MIVCTFYRGRGLTSRNSLRASIISLHARLSLKQCSLYLWSLKTHGTLISFPQPLAFRSRSRSSDSNFISNFLLLSASCSFLPRLQRVPLNGFHLSARARGIILGGIILPVCAPSSHGYQQGLWLDSQLEVLKPSDDTLKGDVWHLRLYFISKKSNNDIHTRHKWLFFWTCQI